MLFLSALLLTSYGLGQAGLGSVQGSVIDKDTKDPIPFVKVVISQGGIIKGVPKQILMGDFNFHQLQQVHTI